MEQEINISKRGGRAAKKSILIPPGSIVLGLKCRGSARRLRFASHLFHVHFKPEIGIAKLLKMRNFEYIG